MAVKENLDNLIQERIHYLREGTDFVSTVFESLVGYGIIAADFDGNIIAYNEGARQIYGYAPEEIIGKQDFEIFFPEDFIEAGELQHIIESLVVWGRHSYEGEKVRENGERFPAHISFEVTQDKSEQVVGFVEIVKDLTERKRAEDELRRQHEKLEEINTALARSNSELEQFAYVASHDLQEPLRMVSSFLQLLADRYRDKLDADANEYISFAVDGATRMHALINDLLSYSRVSTRGKPFEPIDCRAVLKQALSNLQTAIEEKNVRITHDALPTVLADSSQLVQLFQNLIGNAIKFCDKEEPYIEILTKPEGSDWVFSVNDNGIGIDPKYAERIFAVFKRLHSREEYPGTGIGLSICRKIVERHGGRIWVESTPGMGSTFYFTLPLEGNKQP